MLLFCREDEHKICPSWIEGRLAFRRGVQTTEETPWGQQRALTNPPKVCCCVIKCDFFKSVLKFHYFVIDTELLCSVTAGLLGTRAQALRFYSRLRGTVSLHGEENWLGECLINSIQRQIKFTNRIVFVNRCTLCYRLEEEQKLILTPFERNLDFWRQLWRVIERRWALVCLFSAIYILF